MDSPIPAMQAPVDAHMEGGGSGGGGDSWEASARLSSNLGTSEITEHYAEQVRDANWADWRHENTDEGIATRTFMVRDDDGRRWHGLLTVAALPKTDMHMLTFQATAIAGDD